VNLYKVHTNKLTNKQTNKNEQKIISSLYIRLCFFYYFRPFIFDNPYHLHYVSSGHISITVQNPTHVYVNFFDHKDLGSEVSYGEVSYCEVLGDKCTMYIRVTLY
jgi:hypothetical protein